MLAASAARGSTPSLPPFDADLRVGKNSTVYRAHSYHTKVPPDAIAPVIEHFTRPGDVVLDPFCGSGMTGVAAVRLGRHAILSDISTAAVHIATNYVTPCDAAGLSRAIERLLQRVRPTMAELYEVPGPDKARATVEYTVWSDVFACPRCDVELLYWNAGRSKQGTVTDDVRCDRCGARHAKRDLRWVGERPVETHLSVPGTRVREVHAPTAPEIALIARAEAAPAHHWWPKVVFGAEREMWRAAHTAAGITTVADFFTRRNLLALSALRHGILDEPDQRLRDALLFAFTACVNRASKRYQWNAKRPTNVMTGTLYVSSLRYEWNVLRLFERKAADAVRYYQYLGTPSGRAEVVLASAASLAHVPDDCVDLVFMDPPFGSNIYYADSALLWEAWLGRLTDDQHEMVVHRRRSAAAGGLDVRGYGERMAMAFAEVRRVLRPGASAVLVFNNTDGAVWQALQDAIRDAGLEVAGSSMLDKVHPSIKGVKGLQGREEIASFDAVITLRPVRRQTQPKTAAPVAGTDEHIRRALGRLGSAAGQDTRPDRLHSQVVRMLLEEGAPLTGVTMERVRTLALATAPEPTTAPTDPTHGRGSHE